MNIEISDTFHISQDNKVFQCSKVHVISLSSVLLSTIRHCAPVHFWLVFGEEGGREGGGEVGRGREGEREEGGREGG